MAVPHLTCNQIFDCLETTQCQSLLAINSDYVMMNFMQPALKSLSLSYDYEAFVLRTWNDIGWMLIIHINLSSWAVNQVPKSIRMIEDLYVTCRWYTVILRKFLRRKVKLKNFSSFKKRQNIFHIIPIFSVSFHLLYFPSYSDIMTALCHGYFHQY